MIRRIQALNYRCLRYVDIDLDNFHILVGPNGSGKSALFDVIAFLRDLFAEGLEDAVSRRTNNFQDLVWSRPQEGSKFELALELDRPKESTRKHVVPTTRYRYELIVEELHDGFRITFDNIGLVTASTVGRSIKSIPPTICSSEKNASSNDSTLADAIVSVVPNMTQQELTEKYSRITFLPLTLKSIIRELFLDSHCLRSASPPKHRSSLLEHNGSNTAWVVQRLQKTDRDRFKGWLRHIRTVIRDLEDIRVIEREDDRHAYLMIRYSNGVEVPSWAVSEGTLRLLALTLLAYLPDKCIYLVEEPENGIHPPAIEAVYQSLSSVYDSQVLIASHSPELLMCAEPKDVLCFSKDEEGATQIIPGDQHPRLAHWRSAADVDLLFASEIMG